MAMTAPVPIFLNGTVVALRLLRGEAGAAQALDTSRLAILWSLALLAVAGVLRGFVVDAVYFASAGGGDGQPMARFVLLDLLAELAGIVTGIVSILVTVAIIARRQAFAACLVLVSTITSLVSIPISLVLVISAGLHLGFLRFLGAAPVPLDRMAGVSIMALWIVIGAWSWKPAQPAQSLATPLLLAGATFLLSRLFRLLYPFGIALPFDMVTAMMWVASVYWIIVAVRPVLGAAWPRAIAFGAAFAVIEFTLSVLWSWVFTMVFAPLLSGA